MKWLIIILLTIALLACEKVTNYEPENCPENIPVSALWTGGPDGGVYLKIEESSGVYSGSIYFDTNGKVWYEGSFKQTGKETFDVTDGSYYSAWDEDALYRF